MHKTNEMLNYLKDLENNNNRYWFSNSFQTRKLVTKEFENLIAEFIIGIQGFDNKIPTVTPSSLTFKLVRDTRYSKDKTPYLPAFRAHIGPNGKLPIPVGYFIFISPGNKSFIGGGLFTDIFTEATKMIRDHIYKNQEKFISIIEDKEFKNTFEILGKQLKNVPKNYDSKCIVANYLKNKSWYLEFKLNDLEISNDQELLTIIQEKFRLMKPFNDFINQALIDFKMPERRK